MTKDVEWHTIQVQFASGRKRTWHSCVMLPELSDKDSLAFKTLDGMTRVINLTEVEHLALKHTSTTVTMTIATFTTEDEDAT